MDLKTNGCFAWLKNIKKTLNERWARFRTKHNKRDKIDNISTTYLHHLLARRNERALLDQFINEILNNAQTDIESQIRHVESALDIISMTSSVISQIAEAVVTDSLTSVVHNVNQSAETNRPKTLTELMNTFGIVNETNDDGMPAVSD
ncbi:hypothetical protein ACF0H5_016757 [Mactra antiquata]